jgi:hypothetical protein
VRVENGGQAKLKKIGSNNTHKAYCISIPEECDPDEE